MNNITLPYNDALSVNFTSDAWFNATTVAKHFKKKANEWLRLDSTVDYINCLTEIQKRENPAFDENQLVITKKGSPESGGGSWFHPKLAIAFARWLDVRFSIWCDMQIEKILHPAQYGLRQLPTLPAPRAKKAIKGGLELWHQDAINDFIKERMLNVPQDRKAAMVIRIYSSINTKFGTKGMKDGYKNIAPEHFDNIMQFIARLPLDENLFLTFTSEEFEAAIAERVKVLPAPEHEAKTGEVLPKQQHDRITLDLAPLAGHKQRRILITQASNESLIMATLADDKMVQTHEESIRELKHKNYVVFDKTNVSVRKMVLDYVPAQFLPELIEAAAQRLQAIERGKLAS